MLYASAQVDKQKAGRLAESIQEGFKDLGSFRTAQRNGAANVQKSTAVSSVARDRLELERLQTELEQSLAAEIARNEIRVYLGRDGLVLSLRESGFFDSASAQVRPEAMERFGRMAKVLSEHRYRLRVEGHTDNLPIHNSRFASNWELSTARATEVVRLLVTGYGFDPERLSAAGYAEFHPAADNATEEGRQANRRVDVVVVAGTGNQENAR